MAHFLQVFKKYPKFSRFFLLLLIVTFDDFLAGSFVGVHEPAMPDDTSLEGLEQVYENDQLDSADDENLFDNVLATVGGTDLFDE